MKKLLILAYVLALAFVQSACNKTPAATAAYAPDTAAPTTAATATATAEPTSAPTEPPAPNPTPAPRPATAIAVKGDGGLVAVTGSDDGETLWSREFKIEEETELQPWSEATLAGAVAYLQVDYHMLALNTTTGETLWTSDANGGLCKPVVFEDMVYTCSYYGEPLIGISAEDGVSIFAVEPFSDYIWPYAIELSGETLTVRFNSTGSDNEKKGIATFTLAGELIEKKAD